MLELLKALGCKILQTINDIMQSNIRPKCEPRITVSGTDVNGTLQTVVWNAKDIQSLTFKRSIDPAGRNLPIMELQWTELYYGKFNASNFPIKYSNIVKYMAVTLEFEQSLSFFRTWKEVKSLTWKEVKNLTWKALKDEVSKATIKMPMMFLAATPEISGNTIKWTAKDALSFLTESQVKDFDGSHHDIPFYNPIVYLLVNARATFYHSKELFDYFTRTINYFNELEKTKVLNNGVIFDGNTNSEIMCYLSPISEYLDFDTDKIIKKTFTGKRTEAPEVTIPLRLQYGSPTIEPVLNISRYVYNKYIMVSRPNDVYELSPARIVKQVTTSEGTTYYLLEYLYKGYGTTEDSGASDSINRALAWSANPSKTIEVTPFDYSGLANEIVINKVGENYEEDNHCNVYDVADISDKANALKSWYSEKNHIIKTQTPAMFDWNIGEFANCETLAYNEDNTRYIAPAMLVECTMEYNGAIKQTNVAHEVKELSI